MTRHLLPSWIFLLAACPGAVVLAEARTPEGLLKEALHQDQTLRQPEAAAATYRKVIDAAEVVPGVRAEAHLRLGVCLERMGRTEEARKQFELIVREFSDQVRLVNHAQRRLAAISAGDPAMLMPRETLLYVELVRPGLQAQRLIASLKGLDEAGLERLLDRMGFQRDLRTIRATFTDAMLEDINRIDSVALGVVSKESLPGRIGAKFLLVLHPGKSVVARGVLSLMAQSAGKPDGKHDDVSLWAIPDGDEGVLTFATLPSRPGLSGVMLLGKDRQVVCQAIDRWRAGAKASGLATLTEFRRQAAARRRDSVVLVYADVPRILDRLQRDLGPNDRARYAAGRQLLALDAIERGMARVALLDNGFVFELSLMFNDKPNPFYTMFQTPPADQSLLDFVPTDAAAAVLVSLGRGQDKWAQIEAFLEQLASIGRTLSGVETLDVASAIRGAEGMTGLSIGDDLLGNCRSLAVILPAAGPSGSDLTDSPAANLVLALRMHRPDEFIRRWDEALLDQLRVGMDTRQIAGVPTRIYIDTPTASGAAVAVARVGDVILMTLSANMLERVLQARASGDVIARSSLGRPGASAIPPSASKIVLFRPELLYNGLRTIEGRKRLAFQPSRPVLAYTLEQARQAALRVEVTDLTGLLNNAILAAGSASPASAPTTTTASSRRRIEAAR